LLRVYQPNGQTKFHPVRVDYSTLRVRELGTIYEGLLEWRLEPMSPAQLKAGSVKLLGDKQITRKVQPGDFTLVADQSDRKATGSYYTPHYVVEFIVKNTLDPLLKEIKKQRNADPVQIISRVLDLRILDPAMGSGHFLVFAVEFLADCVFEQLGKIHRIHPRAPRRALHLRRRYQPTRRRALQALALGGHGRQGSPPQFFEPPLALRR
jgi:hypothetical protein